MDYSLKDTADIHQWIKRVQEESETSAERLVVDTRTSSILKQAEKERLEDEIELLKQKYLGKNREPVHRSKPNQNLQSSSPSHHSPSHHSPSSHNSNVPVQKHSSTESKPNQNNKKLDALKSKYTKFGNKPPGLEDYAFYGVDKSGMESEVERALNVRDLHLVDFDHPPYESEWKRKFSSDKTKQESRTTPPVEYEDVKHAPNPNTSPRRKPDNSANKGKVTETHRKRVAVDRDKEKSPRKDEHDSEPSLVANFDPLAIEAHSLLNNWIGGNKLAIDKDDDEASGPLSRWQQLKAGIQDLDKPSMLLPNPDPRSISHHTASSRRKVVPVEHAPKQEEKKSPIKIPVAYDPRPKMEARHEQVQQMQKRRAEDKKSEERKRKEELEEKNRIREHEEEKRRLEKQAQERNAKALEDEMLVIKLKREEEAALVKEEERKMLDAHKVETQRKLREQREKIALEEARRIGAIRKEEEEKRRRMKEEQSLQLATAHSDRKIMQKCLSTWFLHVRALKLKLEKFKMVSEWKKVNQTFKVWRRYAQNSKAEREANQFATRAKEEQRNLDRAIKFRDYRVQLRTFLIWRARAKLKGEQKQVQDQHDQRKQQMAQFLQRMRQGPSPNPETPPLPKQETPPPHPSTKNIAKPGAKKAPALKGSPSKASPNRPKLPDQVSPSPNSVKSPSGKASPTVPSSQLQNVDGATTPKKKSEELNVDPNKNYTPPGVSRAYLEMESRAEERKNKRKELEQKYMDAQKRKEEKMKEEEEKERMRIEAEKQAKIEQKRLVKQREAANQRRKEIEEQSEKLAIKHDEERLIKFLGWLPWRKYMTMQNAKLQMAIAHFEKKQLFKFSKAWREVTKQIIDEKLKFADEFYEDTLQLRSWNTWIEALRRSRVREEQAISFCNMQIQKRQFVVWIRKARVEMEKKAAEDLRMELEMEKYYSSAIVKKMWRAWLRFVIISKDEKKSEKRKDDMRQKAHEWLLQYRQAKAEK